MSGQIEQPRYRQIADALMSDIESGEVPVGSRLPGEFELCDRFGVSRHTVREALRLLEECGVIGRRKGFGTVVLADRRGQAFVQTVASIGDLFQYPSGTRLQLQERVAVVADEEVALHLGVEARSEWTRLSGVRRVLDTGQRICWTDVYVRPEYGAIAEHIGRRDQPVYSLIEELFGERIENVDLEIRAVLLNRELAEALGSDHGSPALSIIRRYRCKGKRVCEVSVTTHPADQFTYRVHLARDWLDRKGPAP